jgi:hypothetical protein
MDIRAKPDGYISSLAAHTDPLSSNTSPAPLEKRADETLFDMCLKAFIKERLYGRFINYNPKNQSQRFLTRSSLNQVHEQLSLKNSMLANSGLGD